MGEEEEEENEAEKEEAEEAEEEEAVEEEEKDAKPNPVPNPQPTPVPSPVQSPGSAERCVATLESHYTDASIWEPYCKTVGDLGTCPSPMCKTTTSLLATSKRHSFLGNALLQTGSEVDFGTLHAAEEL